MTDQSKLYSWLPELLLMEEHGNSWEDFLEAVYQAFRDDFVASPPTQFDGKRFSLKRYPESAGKEATFWHCISEGEDEANRLPDLRRCERIRWIRAIMDADAEHIHRWENRRRHNETRILLALPDFSYVVILADRGPYVMLWTAYCVTDHRRHALKKEYEDFQKRLKPPQ
jgi:hypothetical protein